MHHLKVTFDKLMHVLNDVLGEQPALFKNGVRPGPKHRFTDIEVIALSLTADYIGITSENHLFTAINSDYKDYFPHLLSRRRYNYRLKKLKDKINLIRELISNKMNKKRMTQDIYIIDSMPLRLTKFSRRYNSTICRDDASLVPKIAYCAAQKENYYGFKINTICNGDGIIKAFKLSSGSLHDIHYLDDLDERFTGCRIIGDKGYISIGKKRDLFKQYRIQLETPPKINQKDKDLFIWGKERKVIEVLFSQLNDQFNMQKNYAKTVTSYVTRIYSKLCTLTLLQFVNKNKGRRVGRLKYALR